ncbi:MAG: flippase-like domain-containing protein [Candidatus Omnitrophica bacterium]|nr:flippase-like domain-containing protein [Candidatus Omnitrophota bacterium]
MKTKLASIARIIISLFFLILLFYLRRDSLGLTLETIKGLKPVIYASSCLTFVAAVTILAIRLTILLKAQNLSLRLPETMKLTFMGFFFNNFLPTAIGGDIVKGYYAYKKTGKKLVSFVSVFMDRYIGFLTLFILAGISLIFGYSHIKMAYLGWITAAILFILILFLAVFLNKDLLKFFSILRPLIELIKIRPQIEKLYNAINAFKDKKALIGRAVAVSIFAQIIGFVTIYLLIKGLGNYIPLKTIFLLMPIISVISMLPSINGLGIRESAIYFFFGPYIGHENAFALSLLWLSLLFIASIIGGLCYLFGNYGGIGVIKKEGVIA